MHLNLAIAYRSLQRWPEAARHYEAWSRGEPNPRDPAPLFDMAYAYEQMGRREDAARIYTRYISLTRDGEDRQAAQDRLDALQ